MKILLASKSPRRRQLLQSLGFPFECVSAEVDESVDTSTPPHLVAQTIASKKADAFPVDNLAADEVLLAADTVVVHRDTVLGKPADRDAAVAMLRSLSADCHKVYTGVCLRSASLQYAFTECTSVYFRPLSEDDIAFYVDSFHPFDKAGAYGIQEWIGMVGVDRIDGCFYNVMGLPTARLYEVLTSRFSSR